MLDQLAVLMSGGLAVQDAPNFESTWHAPVLGPSTDDLTVMLSYYGIVCGIAVISLAISIWAYTVLMLAMMKVPIEHRKMIPGLVWLNFIPCVALVWSFFIAIWIPQSLNAALQARGKSARTGFAAGMVWAVLPVVNIVPAAIGVFVGLRISMAARSDDTPRAQALADFLPFMAAYPLALLALIALIVFVLRVRRAARVLVEDGGDQGMSAKGEAW